MKEKHIVPFIFAAIALVLSFSFYKSQPKAEETLQSEMAVSQQDDDQSLPTNIDQTYNPVERSLAPELIENLTLVSNW